MDDPDPRQHHDLGGVPRFMCRPVDTEPHALTAFDREVDALRQILGAKRVMSVDELRRGVEAIPEAEYHCLTYYQRWIRSIADNLLRSGAVTEAELAAALDRVGAPTETSAPDPARRPSGRGHDPAALDPVGTLGGGGGP